MILAEPPIDLIAAIRPIRLQDAGDAQNIGVDRVHERTSLMDGFLESISAGSGCRLEAILPIRLAHRADRDNRGIQLANSHLGGGKEAIAMRRQEGAALIEGE